LRELTKAIYKVSRATDLAGSLIVLPEAFNLGREYDPNYSPKETPRLCARRVLGQLRRIAATYEVAFVLSIIEAGTRRNSAYFVDSGLPRLLCRKIIDDGSQEYQPYTSDYLRRGNPITYPGPICIGALICADAMDNRRRPLRPDAEEAYNQLTSLRSKLTGRRGVLCVPAYMLTEGKDVGWCGDGLILANSRPRCPSFIKNRNGDMLYELDELQNRIHLEDLRRIMT
jgi:hypothetical protein